MTPLYIKGCFAMLHPAAGNRGAVICGTLSDDALNSYRALAFLAEQVADAGMPALRIAYRGTGDSAGDDEEPGRFDQWINSIRDAAQWLRQNCGVRAVTLIGHRVGASLAARAASDGDGVDSLVLLNPASGRQLLHELTLSARISQRVWGTSHKLDDGVWFESHGLRIDHATRDALQMLDVRKQRVPLPAHVLWMETEQRAATNQQAEAWEQAGIDVTCAVHAGLAWMQRDSYAADVPVPAFESAVRWMQALPEATVAPAPAGPVLAATLDTPFGQETPVHFGADSSLFGILAAPACPASAAPAVLLVNTSANPRWGNARIAVEIARALAADGIISLRMDASGIGDSAPATGSLGRPYAEATTQDVLQGVAALEQRTQRPVVVVGICSGAYHALQAACRDTRARGLVLVNLQRFVWREGDLSDTVRRTDLRPTAFYLRNIRDPHAWYRLLRADFDVARLVRVLLTRLVRRGVAAIDPVLSLLSGGGTQVGRVRKMMRALVRRGLPILYVLGANDPGVEELAAYFGKDGDRLRRQPNVTMQVLENADHTLGAAATRAALLEAIRAWCRAHWPEPHRDVDRQAAAEPQRAYPEAPAPARRSRHPAAAEPVALLRVVSSDRR